MIDKQLLDEIGDNWIVRYDNDGKSYNAFQWASIGEWTKVPDWNPEPICGGGLHGQGPGGFGVSQPGTRFVFAETRGPRVVVDGDKIKVREARILYVNQDALDALVQKCNGVFPGSLDVRKGATLTAPGLKQVTGSLYVREGATLTAPGLKQVTGSFDVREGATLTAPGLTPSPRGNRGRGR